MSNNVRSDEGNNTGQLSQIEKMVSVIWAEVLQEENIEPEDNFFELGGDSLMTMMVLFRVNDIYHMELPPYTISQAPTLREFCQEIDANKTNMTEEGFNNELFLENSDEESGLI